MKPRLETSGVSFLHLQHPVKHWDKLIDFHLECWNAGNMAMLIIKRWAGSGPAGYARDDSMTKAFISYSPKDTGFTRKLADALTLTLASGGAIE
jgi:hypothetical protein